tara:strand:+ start:787 stop:936 length:150 start_codon:yes stop_codon:yes gene_type:complete
MKIKKQNLAMIGAVISILGIAVLWNTAGWGVALGALILVWGNNVEQQNR